MRTSRWIWTGVASGALFAVGMLAGALALRTEAFPYRIAKGLWSRVNPEEQTGPAAQRLATELASFDRREFALSAPKPTDTRGGGGISAIPGGILGVDKWGEFFVWRSSSGIRSLGMRLATGSSPLEAKRIEEGGDFAEERRRGMDPERLVNWNLRSFRVTDVMVAAPGGKSAVFVAYSVWNDSAQCKSLVVDRLDIPSLSQAPEAIARASADSWKRVYETKPCIPYSVRYNSAFQSTNTGGRLELLDDRTLLFSVGDHHLDGLNDTTRASQDTTSDYGKILAVDLPTRSRSVFALGIRNPQGLHRDAEGQIWETEHGPEGGDELNLLERGGNYGWPLTTFGRQYNSQNWPLSATPDRHVGFAAPRYAWVPSIAPSSLVRVPSGSSAWAGDLLVTSLRAGSIFRIRLDGQRVVSVEAIPMGGRIRDIAVLDSGTLALWMDSRKLVLLSQRAAGTDEAGMPVAFTADEKQAGLPSVMAQCASCHRLEEGAFPGTAPVLWGVVGSAIASSSYSGYSNGLRAIGGKWSIERIQAFLVNPSSFAPGTTMPPQLEGNPEMARAVAMYLSRLR